MKKVDQVLQNVNLSKYATSLLLTGQRKVMTNLCKPLNLSHDSIQRELDNTEQQIESVKSHNIKTAQKLFGNRNLKAYIDDTTISKPHSFQLDGIDTIYSSGEKRTISGLSSVVVMLSDGINTIPVNADLSFTKKISQEKFISKPAIAVAMIKELMQHFRIKEVIGDGLYSTKEMITSLKALGINFLMKITRTKKVTINGNTEQIQNCVRLKKNNHYARSVAIFNGVKVYIYAVKIAPGKVNYYIASYKIPKEKVLGIYRNRWVIECFFRTAKQKLGLQECQARTSEKQLLHNLYIIQAYQIAVLIRCKMKFDNVDQAVNYLQSLNLKGYEIGLS